MDNLSCLLKFQNFHSGSTLSIEYITLLIVNNEPGIVYTYTLSEDLENGDDRGDDHVERMAPQIIAHPTNPSLASQTPILK